jgi:hypothetical protein
MTGNSKTGTLFENKWQEGNVPITRTHAAWLLVATLWVSFFLFLPLRT